MDLKGNFLTYLAYNIRGNNLLLSYPNNAQECMDQCLANPSCHTAEFHTPTRSCNLASVTFLTAPAIDKVLGTDDGWAYYQRTCA